jgi:hypothetical protein
LEVKAESCKTKCIQCQSRKEKSLVP